MWFYITPIYPAHCTKSREDLASVQFKDTYLYEDRWTRSQGRLTPVCGLRWFRWYFTTGLHPLNGEGLSKPSPEPYYTSQLLGLKDDPLLVCAGRPAPTYRTIRSNDKRLNGLCTCSLCGGIAAGFLYEITGPPLFVYYRWKLVRQLTKSLFTQIWFGSEYSGKCVYKHW